MRSALRSPVADSKGSTAGTNCQCLRNREYDGLTGPTAGATDVSGVSAGSAYGDAGSSRSGDERGGDGDRQLFAAQDLGGERRPIDDNDRGTHELAAMEGEQKSRLHLSESDASGRKRGEDGSGAGAIAQRIQGIATWKDQQGEQQYAERWERRTDSFHGSSYTLVRDGGSICGTEVTVQISGRPTV